MTYGYTNSAGANNGNVTSLNSTATQIFMRSYTYDSLNRLWTMSSPVDASGCYGLLMEMASISHRPAELHPEAQSEYLRTGQTLQRFKVPDHCRDSTSHLGTMTCK
jgi:hypothetical protein